MADLYNLFNFNSVLTRNQAVGPSYYVPETILQKLVGDLRFSPGCSRNA
jgi:hypothetical protein